MKKYGENNGESGFCGVGLIQIYIKVDGRIFGCAANLEDSGCIGDVENGLSKECIKRLRKIGKEGNMCSKMQLCCEVPKQKLHHEQFGI